MSKPAVAKAMNDQVAMEFHAAYLYLSMSAYLESQNLPGFAKWMRMQYQEEVVHALRFFDYLLEAGDKAELQAVAKPAATFKGPLDVFKKSLAHEKKVTASINKIYEAAVKSKDYPAQIMLQWFIDEQQEEERTVGEIIAQLEMVGGNGPALLMLDRELASRGPEAEA
ncbi:MAG: ferritin [Gemmatimonadota bacterium]|nr:ferritin [Gemmatimonadota bacterium]